MKRMCILFIVLLLLFIVTGCSNEVGSETEARRVLLSCMSDLAEIEKVLDEMDKNDLNSEDVNNARKRLDNVLVDIVSTEDYYPVEAVKERYDSTKDKYDELDKLCNTYLKLVEDQED